MSMDLGRLLSTGAKGMGIGTALLGGTAAGLWWQLFRRPLPRTAGDVRVRGVEGRIEIVRDRWGMPTVRAETAADLWYGQGFCHGQDRLWQCEVNRRITAGRIVEIAGRDGLPVDRLMRTLGLRRLSLREEAELEPGLRTLLDAYCAGLNEAARLAPAPPAEFQLLRFDFEPWRPADMLAGGKLLSFGLSTNWERELLRADLVRELGEELAARIDPTYPKGNPVALTPGQGFDGDGLRLAEQIGRVRDQIGLAAAASGSNNWAVTPARSATGGALLAGDPHLPSGMPGIWYEVALELGDRAARGASIPGLPGISLGQNDDVAWAFTNVMADVEDLFVERIEDESYEFQGERRPLEIVEELIAIRGEDQPERHEVRITHHGPIVNSALGADDEQPLALRWAALDEPAISPAHVGVLDPTSGPELVEMLSTVTMPVSNLVWADRHGSIGYKMMGRVPRRNGDCPDLPKPGCQREIRAIERLKSWDRVLGPNTVAGTIYQAFLLRLAREFTRAAIGDRDLAERYLDRADNGFIAHVTSPWRWHSHLLALWAEGDDELIGGPWDELVLEALRGALDDLEGRFGPDPEAWRWGRVHALHFPHALGGGRPVAARIF